MRRRPILLGLLALLSSTLVAGAAMPAGAGSKPPAVPRAIQVPAGQKVVLDVVGKGVQIYDCKPSARPGVLAWTFREPAAVLYGHRERPVGIHFRGPTFESFDGSSVLGALQASAPAPDPETAIAWLLLRAVSNRGRRGARRGRLHPTPRDPGRGGTDQPLRPGPGRDRGRALPGPLRLLRRLTLLHLGEAGLALLPVSGVRWPG